MNLPDHFGTGQVQDIVVAFQVYRMGDKFTTAKIGFCQTAEDVQTCIEKIREQEDILAAIAIKDDKLGICGNFELKLF